MAEPAPPPPAQPSSSSLAPPPQLRRPGFGRSGRPVRLLCNHFLVDYKPSKDAYHYNVNISIAGMEPGREVNLDKTLTRSILYKVHKTYRLEFGGKVFAYDGEKSLYTPGPLPFQMNEFSIILEDAAIDSAGPSTSEDSSKRRKVVRRGREFSVKVEYVATVKMAAILSLLNKPGSEMAQTPLQVLDIVLRQHAAAKEYLLIKDNFFSDKIGVSDIGGGVQTWHGFHVSFRPSRGGLSLNMDIATTTVLKPSALLEFVRERYRVSNFERIDWNKVKRELKGIRVETLPSKVVHKIAGFSSLPSSELTFMRKSKDEAGGLIEMELTVAKYYELQYQIYLRHPELPCIQAGRPKKPIFIPVELCHIMKGQRYTKALNNDQRKAMIEQARLPPQQRRSKIETAMNPQEYNGDPVISDFDITIRPQMRTVKGRVLYPPELRFGNQKVETPTNGKWKFMDKVMESGAKVDSWLILNFDSRTSAARADEIARQFSGMCQKKGMEMGPYFILQESPHVRNSSAPERVRKMIAEAQRRSKTAPTFLLCMLPIKKTCDLYGPLKKQLETEISVTTQCIVPSGKVDSLYLTNVALKLNAKLGGHNSLLAKELPKVSQIPTLILGMDVSHGSGFSDSPSIAAIVGSREWPRFSKYGVRLRAQPRRTEMIAGLFEEKSGGVIRELLNDFYKSSGNIKPQQIIIYRDGVSESQFEQVLREEYTAFKKAFEHIQPDGLYNPRITFIVVQKRHHTRFFPSENTGERNVAPGTIVDDELCHPHNYDFYLCSHYGLMGTSRPTHYHVLVDENNFSVDELQQLTYHLCYIYARSTTAVSTVTPVAYAHLAAMHARNFLDSDSSSEGSLMAGRPNQVVDYHFPELHTNMKEKMFYC